MWSEAPCKPAPRTSLQRAEAVGHLFALQRLGLGRPSDMQTLDDGTKRRAIQLSFEILRNLEYLLSASKPLTNNQIVYCLMLHDEIEKLRWLIFDETTAVVPA